MTEQQFIDSSRQLALAVLKVCERHEINGATGAKLACAALGEAVAQMIGPVQAIERIRDVADLLEADILDRRVL
jgi:hypothetical protein